MRQSCIRKAFGLVPDLPTDPTRLEVYDLFCGVGGFSCGAEAAGCRVAFACDADDDALTAHAANHPQATHRRLLLPADAIPFPTDGRRFHVHGSPPCPEFSPMKTRGRVRDARERAGSLIEWYMRTALASRATSWSMEQVAAKSVVAIVERVRAEFPKRVAYAKFDLRELGVPQTRTRLIAGTPELVARLLRLRSRARRRGVRDVVPNPRGTHLRNSKYWDHQTLRRNRHPDEPKYLYDRATGLSHSAPVSEPGPTVVTTGQLYWIDAANDGTVWTPLDVPELAALQTFPPRYKFPRAQRVARRLIGNAVPPLVATLLLGGEAPPPPPPLPARPSSSPSLLRPASSYPVW